MNYHYIIALKKRLLRKNNYLAVVITLLLVLVLPLLLYGLSQIQNFTDHAGTINLNFQSQLGSIQLDQTDVIVNKPTVLNLTIPQKHGYDALAIKIDTRYLSNLNLKDLQDLFLIKKIEANNAIVYLLSSKQFNNNLPRKDWIKELTIKKPSDSIISPTKCFPEYCTPDYPKQTVSLKLKRKLTLHYTLTKPLTITQRPIQIIDYSLISNHDQAFYSFNTYRPKLQISQSVKNTVPVIVSTPPNWAIANQPLTYNLQILDADNDKTTIFLDCPNFQTCTSSKKENPAGLSVIGHQLTFNFLQASTKPYHINTYISDGKATTKHSFDILVKEKSTASPPICQVFKTEYPIKTIAINEETPLTLLAKDYKGITKIVVEYTNLTVDPNSPENIQIWNWNPASAKINLTQYDEQQPLAYFFKKGDYEVKAIITNQNDLTTECYLRQQNIQSSISQSNLAKYNPSLPFKKHSKNINFHFLLPSVQAKNNGNTITTGINSPPTFTSDPYKNALGNVTLGSAYNYSLAITDVDKDMLQHIIVTKPSWAKLAVVSNAGDLKLNITGTPNKIGAHTFSFSITDGYNSHYITQTWVVNVEDPENDIPRITVTNPQGTTQINQGERLAISWQASDRQQITDFNIYLTSSPAGNSNRQLILGGLKYNVRSANINTRHLPAGRFYVLVEGKDNFNPPATGFAVSGIVNIIEVIKPTVIVTPTATVIPQPTITPNDPIPTIIPNDQKPTIIPDDPLFLLPIATNLLPLPQTTVDDTTPLISASLQASNNATLIKKQIQLLLDEQDITVKSKFAGDKKVKGAISYLPTADLNPGQHFIKIIIKDSANKENTIKWTFTLKESDENTDENINEDNNEDNETITILGYTIPKQIAIFLAIGILVVLIALILPLLLFMTWRKSEPTPMTLTGINPNREPSYDKNNLYSTFDDTPAPVPGIISTDHEIDKAYQKTNIGYPKTNKTPTYEKVSVDQFDTTLTAQSTEETSDNIPKESLLTNSLQTNNFTDDPNVSANTTNPDNEPVIEKPNKTDQNIADSHVPDFMPPEPAKPNYPSINPPS